MAWEDFKKRISSANAVILNAEKRYGKDSKIVKSIYSSLSEAYNTKNVGDLTRFRFPARDLSLREVAKIDRALQRIETAKTLTKSGREQISIKARESWAESHPEMDISVLDQYIKVKSSLGSLVYKTSEQIMSELNDMPEKLSKRDLNKIISEYSELASADKGTDIEFFEYLRDRGVEMINEKMARRNKGKILG